MLKIIQINNNMSLIRRYKKDILLIKLNQINFKRLKTKNR